MRTSALLGSLLATVGIGTIAIASPSAPDVLRVSVDRLSSSSKSKAPKRRRRRRQGKDYPFSSTRQNARYARQIAAGQLSMAGIERR